MVQENPFAGGGGGGGSDDDGGATDVAGGAEDQVDDGSGGTDTGGGDAGDVAGDAPDVVDEPAPDGPGGGAGGAADDAPDMVDDPSPDDEGGGAAGDAAGDAPDVVSDPGGDGRQRRPDTPTAPPGTDRTDGSGGTQRGPTFRGPDGRTMDSGGDVQRRQAATTTTTGDADVDRYRDVPPQYLDEASDLRGEAAEGSARFDYDDIAVGFDDGELFAMPTEQARLREEREQMRQQGEQIRDFRERVAQQQGVSPDDVWVSQEGGQLTARLSDDARLEQAADEFSVGRYDVEFSEVSGTRTAEGGAIRGPVDTGREIQLTDEGLIERTAEQSEEVAGMGTLEVVETPSGRRQVQFTEAEQRRRAQEGGFVGEGITNPNDPVRETLQAAGERFEPVSEAAGWAITRPGRGAAAGLEAAGAEGAAEQYRQVLEEGEQGLATGLNVPRAADDLYATGQTGAYLAGAWEGSPTEIVSQLPGRFTTAASTTEQAGGRAVEAAQENPARTLGAVSGGFALGYAAPTAGTRAVRGATRVTPDVGGAGRRAAGRAGAAARATREASPVGVAIDPDAPLIDVAPSTASAAREVPSRAVGGVRRTAVRAGEAPTRAARGVAQRVSEFDPAEAYRRGFTEMEEGAAARRARAREAARGAGEWFNMEFQRGALAIEEGGAARRARARQLVPEIANRLELERQRGLLQMEEGAAARRQSLRTAFEGADPLGRAASRIESEAEEAARRTIMRRQRDLGELSTTEDAIPPYEPLQGNIRIGGRDWTGLARSAAGRFGELAPSPIRGARAEFRGAAFRGREIAESGFFRQLDEPPTFRGAARDFQSDIRRPYDFARSGLGRVRPSVPSRPSFADPRDITIRIGSRTEGDAPGYPSTQIVPDSALGDADDARRAVDDTTDATETTELDAAGAADDGGASLQQMARAQQEGVPAGAGTEFDLRGPLAGSVTGLATVEDDATMATGTGTLREAAETTEVTTTDVGTFEDVEPTIAPIEIEQTEVGAATEQRTVTQQDQGPRATDAVIQTPVPDAMADQDTGVRPVPATAQTPRAAADVGLAERAATSSTFRMPLPDPDPSFGGDFTPDDAPAREATPRQSEGDIGFGWLSETYTVLGKQGTEAPAAPAAGRLEELYPGYRGGADLPTEQLLEGDEGVEAAADLLGFGGGSTEGSAFDDFDVGLGFDDDGDGGGFF